MADRAFADIVLQESDGDVRASKALTFFEEDGVTPFGQSLFAAQSGGSALVPPFLTNSVGTFRAYTPNPQRGVALASDDATPFPISFEADPADLILRGQSDRELASLILGPDQSTDIPLIVAGQVGQTAMLTEWRNSSGTVLSSVGIDGALLGGIVTIKGTVTSAKIQAAIDANLAVIIPEGTHTLSTAITLRSGSMVQGMGPGATILSYTGANGSTVFTLDTGVGTYERTNCVLTDFTIQTTATTVVGIKLINSGNDRLERLTFKGVYRPILIDQGMGHTVRSIKLETFGSNPVGGCWFGSTDQTSYLLHLNLEDLHCAFPDGFASGPGAILTFSRIGGANVTGLQLFSPGVIGVRVQNDSQGVNISDGSITDATYGVTVDEDPDYPVASFPTRFPTFTVISNFGIDQCETFGISIARGANTKIIGCGITNGQGPLGTYTGQAINLGGGTSCLRTDILNTVFESFPANAIVCGAGVNNLRISGNRFFAIGNTAGTSIAIAASGSQDNILISDNDFSQANLVAPAVAQISDSSTSGTNRNYLNNVFATGEEPAVAVMTGVTIGGIATRASLTGMTLDQRDGDGEILAFSSTDVTHGMTGVTATGTYGRVLKASAANGGLFVDGLCDTGANGLLARGICVTADTGKTATAIGAVAIDAALKSGTGLAVVGANGNLLTVHNGSGGGTSAAVFIVDAEGNILSDDTASVYDTYDDLALVRALDYARNPAAVIASEFDAFLTEHADALVAAGILHPAAEPGKKPFVSWTRLAWLHNGALTQVSARLQHIEQRLDALALPGAQKEPPCSPIPR